MEERSDAPHRCDRDRRAGGAHRCRGVGDPLLRGEGADRVAAQQRWAATLPARRYSPRVVHPDRAAAWAQPRGDRPGTGAATGTADTERRRLDADQHRAARARSEEHTSELQSLMRISYAV